MPIRLNQLTGLRFFAAAMIMDGHSWRLFGPSYLDGMMLVHGVSIFFVLSGFILAVAYPTTADVTSRNFLRARIARVWPLHILSTLLLLAVVPGVTNQFFTSGGLLTAIQYVTLTQAWLPILENIMAYTAVSWSISAEVFFYATFPLWLMDWGRFNSLKLPVAIMPTIFLIQISNFADLPLALDSPGINAGTMLYFFPVARLPEFVLGVIVGQYWYRRQFRFSSGQSDIASLAAIALSVGALYYAAPIAGSPITAGLLGKAGGVWLLPAGFGPVYALLIFVLASSTGYITRILGSRPLVLLGEISFGMYLFHSIFLRYIERHPDLIAEAPNYWRLVYWVTVSAFSYAAYELFEKPARDWINGRHARKWLKKDETLKVV
ncbi:peptidoglycan/LPS O-acetylase OafA/YrhL [Neorhizobium huautlense]|uniref:Peptidoglycan/LPS O-acetylase OafA/YrhL n=1 Tax=Neorhizobium huautlense TaxID=67774 RepID=A0ABT9Q2N4_9HYPH|nr:acyltransferase [Neorhizobium huautlense]MDP9840710.1 peptidoglycan/LPS O-acetylase OafA/YrhL [Neorhizobium huautlense]